MDIQAFAKVNLYLEITGKRPDGYHELISLMCGIDLHDTLRIQFNTDASQIFCTHPEVPQDASNLALKAARIFFDAIGSRDHISVAIEKNIPLGAGLGGGSSNAAAVLNALNQQYQAPFSRDELMGLGKKIGADVPFFIFDRPALATGIGDQLSAYPHLPQYPIVLVYPGKPVSTAEVYRKLNFGLTKTKKINRKITFRYIRGKDIVHLLYNDLEPTAVEINPDIAEAKKGLLAQGAVGALMSGSGSAVFGLYPNWKSARKAYMNIEGINPNWKVYISQLRAA